MALMHFLSPSMLPGGTKQHGRPDFRGLPGTVLGRNQPRNGGGVSPDGSGWEMGTCSKMKGASEYILYPRYDR